LELIVAPVRRLPLVTMRFVLDVGARQEARKLAGVASLTAGALAEGTLRLDAGALAEHERLGDPRPLTRDNARQCERFCERLASALSLLTEVVRTQPSAVERRSKTTAELLELKSEPRGLADERFASSLYKLSSRLSIQEGGSERSVRQLTVDACRSWHANQFVPGVTALVIAGDVDVDRVVRLASDRLSDWKQAEPPSPAVDDNPAREYPSQRLLDRAGAPQTELRLGHVGLRRSHPEYFDVVVMNAILGGVFNSRINLNLRERNAFTYGAFSAFEWRRDAAPFVVSTAVATPVTASAIREVVSELERMRSGLPTAEELSLSTSYLDGVFPIRFETTDAIAGALATLKTLRLPDDYYDTYRDRIRAVTIDGVARAAREHIHLERLQVLALGDREQVAPLLSDLTLGPVSEIGDDEE
jgi:zinc protease